MLETKPAHRVQGRGSGSAQSVDDLRRRCDRHARPVAVERLSGELFVTGGGVFIANSHPDLAGNLGFCLAHHFRRQGLVLRLT